MKYICAECGHKANTSAKGQCPACSSHRFSRKSHGSVKSDSTVKKASILNNPFVLIVVWSVFAYAIYDLIKSTS